MAHNIVAIIGLRPIILVSYTALRAVLMVIVKGLRPLTLAYYSGPGAQNKVTCTGPKALYNTLLLERRAL